MPKEGDKKNSLKYRNFTVSFKPKEKEILNKLDSIRRGFEADLGFDLGLSGTIKKLIQDY